MKKIPYIFCGLIAIIFIAIVILFNNNSSAGVIYPVPFTNLVGTRTASTTVAVGFYGSIGTNGTTTYPIPLLNSSEASIVFDPVTASTSAQGGSAIYFTLIGSNDPECNTAQTSITAGEHMTVAQIRWFDAMSYVRNAAVITGFVNGTSTIAWTNPTIGAQREVHLEKLNMNCLAVQVAASSTSLFASYRTKN